MAQSPCIGLLFSPCTKTTFWGLYHLVGGFNPFETYYNSSKWKSSPIFGMKIPKIFELPPPSHISWYDSSTPPEWRVGSDRLQSGGADPVGSQKKKALILREKCPNKILKGGGSPKLMNMNIYIYICIIHIYIGILIHYIPLFLTTRHNVVLNLV